MYVFSTYKTRIMTILNDFAMCRTGTGSCCKKVCLLFSLVLISFSKNLVYPAYAKFYFFNQILFSFEHA